MNNQNISPIGRSWEEFGENLLTPEERAASDRRVARMIKRTSKYTIQYYEELDAKKAAQEQAKVARKAKLVAAAAAV